MKAGEESGLVLFDAGAGGHCSLGKGFEMVLRGGVEEGGDSEGEEVTGRAGRIVEEGGESDGVEEIIR